jgi:hypothetical protein
MGTSITYRRSGGLFARLTLAATVMAAVALGIALLIGVATIGAVALLVRAMLPTSWRRQTEPATPWPKETIDATVVTPSHACDQRDLLRIDSDKDDRLTPQKWARHVRFERRP